MKNCKIAARVAVVVALFALPPLLLPDNAAAADRRHGNTGSARTSNAGRQYVPPVPTITPKQAKEIARGMCKGLAYTNPTEAKECLARNR